MFNLFNMILFLIYFLSQKRGNTVTADVGSLVLAHQHNTATLCLKLKQKK